MLHINYFKNRKKLFTYTKCKINLIFKRFTLIYLNKEKGILIFVKKQTKKLKKIIIIVVIAIELLTNSQNISNIEINRPDHFYSNQTGILIDENQFLSNLETEEFELLHLQNYDKPTIISEIKKKQNNSLPYKNTYLSIRAGNSKNNNKSSNQFKETTNKKSTSKKNKKYLGKFRKVIKKTLKISRKLTSFVLENFDIFAKIYVTYNSPFSANLQAFGPNQNVSLLGYCLRKCLCCLSSLWLLEIVDTCQAMDFLGILIFFKRLI